MFLRSEKYRSSAGGRPGREVEDERRPPAALIDDGDSAAGKSSSSSETGRRRSNDYREAVSRCAQTDAGNFDDFRRNFDLLAHADSRHNEYTVAQKKQR